VDAIGVPFEIFSGIKLRDQVEPYFCSIEPLTDEENRELFRAMIDHLTTVAQREGKPKIVVTVHENLRIYIKYYEPEGFVLTERRCQDNSFWIEAELVLPEEFCIK
jgi:hypothetical protein